MPFFQDETDCSLLRKVVGTKVQPSMKGLQYKPVLSSSQDGFEIVKIMSKRCWFDHMVVFVSSCSEVIHLRSSTFARRC